MHRPVPLCAARRASPVRRPCVAGARARGEGRGTWRQSAVEYGQHGVSINAIAPGAIMTEMVKGSLIQIAGEAGWEDAGAQFVSVNPMRRFGEPNEVASLVAFLLSQEAPIHQGRRRAYRRWAVAGILNALRPAAATSIEAGDSHTPQETRCIECYSPSSASRSCRSRSS
jgi:NAD(P)-dependent dehydrogenase (short-subunit alcohol dehydrogenase family)